MPKLNDEQCEAIRAFLSEVYPKCRDRSIPAGDGEMCMRDATELIRELRSTRAALLEAAEYTIRSSYLLEPLAKKTWRVPLNKAINDIRNPDGPAVKVEASDDD